MRFVVRSRYMLTQRAQKSHVDSWSCRISVAGGPKTSLDFWRVCLWWLACRCGPDALSSFRDDLESATERRWWMWACMSCISLRIVRQCVESSSSFMDRSVLLDSSSFWHRLLVMAALCFSRMNGAGREEAKALGQICGTKDSQETGAEPGAF